jgi:hypothetical protein
LRLRLKYSSHSLQKHFQFCAVWLRLAALCGGKTLVITTRNKELVVDYSVPKNYVDYLVFSEV